MDLIGFKGKGRERGYLYGVWRISGIKPKLLRNRRICDFLSSDREFGTVSGF